MTLRRLGGEAGVRPGEKIAASTVEGVYDDQIYTCLLSILEELKKIKLQMSLITGFEDE